MAVWWIASTYLYLIKNDSDSIGSKRYQERQVKGNYRFFKVPSRAHSVTEWMLWGF